MNAMTVAEVAAAIGARPPASVEPDTRVTGVSIDSREAGPGEVFFAFRGERVDGSEFIADALARGAIAGVTEEAGPGARLVVADVLSALGALASAARARLDPRTTVVGITGSAGKTSTKDLVAAVLELDGRTIAPPGSYNNEIGMPLTLLRADAETRHVVLEMGARGRGHIAELCAVARPDVGVVLNVGTAHLGEFGSREAIAMAKQELVESLAPEGTAILNAADPLVVNMARATRARVVTFGAAGSDMAATRVELENGRASFRLEWQGASADVHLRLVGEHQVSNALAAAAVGAAVGIDLAQVAGALSTAAPRSRWRMEVVERADGVTIVNDSYNASPEAMRAALRTLASLGGAGSRRTWAVLANMAELGDSAVEIHEEMGRLAIELDVSRLVVIGERASGIHAGAMTARPSGEGITSVPTFQAAYALLSSGLAAGDVVLVKGARATGLDRLAALLCGEAQ